MYLTIIYNKVSDYIIIIKFFVINLCPPQTFFTGTPLIHNQYFLKMFINTKKYAFDIEI